MTFHVERLPFKGSEGFSVRLCNNFRPRIDLISLALAGTDVNSSFLPAQNFLRTLHIKPYSPLD